MAKIELEHEEEVGAVKCRYKASYEFDKIPDATTLEFLPILIEVMASDRGEENAR